MGVPFVQAVALAHREPTAVAPHMAWEEFQPLGRGATAAPSRAVGAPRVCAVRDPRSSPIRYAWPVHRIGLARLLLSRFFAPAGHWSRPARSQVDAVVEASERLVEGADWARQRDRRGSASTAGDVHVDRGL